MFGPELPLLPVLALIAYAAIVAGWLVLLRRWRLAGPLAPPKAALGRQEHVARRSLKALLAFDALVIVPVSLPAIVGGIIGREPQFALLFLAVMLFFVGPVRHLLRNVRALEARRLAGLPEPVRELLSTGHAGMDRLLRRPVHATRLLVGLIAPVSVVAWFVPGLQEVLEKQNEAILSGQLWRLVTVALVHAGAIHLFLNMSVLLDVGGIVERMAGPGRMLISFWVGTAAATLASVAILPTPAVGASGGIFAVLGALLAMALRHRGEIPSHVRTRLVRSTATAIALNVMLVFIVPRIDWAAHLGGLVAGAVLGWLLGLDREARTVLSGTGAVQV